MSTRAKRPSRTDTSVHSPVSETSAVLLLRAATISRIKPPSKGINKYQDRQEPALVLIVTSDGSMTFGIDLLIGGISQTVLIGKYPELTVAEARQRATVTASQLVQSQPLDQGPLNSQAPQKSQLVSKTQNIKSEAPIVKTIDPSQITFGLLFDLYYRQYAKSRTRDHKELLENYHRHFAKHWGTTLACSIRRADIQHWVNDLAMTSGVYCANRCHDTIRAIFNWGIKSEYFVGNNPAKGIDRFPMQSRDRFIQPGEEFERVAKAFNNLKDEVLRDFFWMCLYTGARCGNVLKMQWSHINLETRMWRIPMTKNGAPHVVSLTDEAVALLRKRQASKNAQLNTSSHADWVFPSPRIPGAHLNSPRKAWARVCRDAGVEDLRIHDLRRTLASYMAIQGASPAIIGKTLGHKSLSSTAIYSRLTQKPVLAAMQQATKLMPIAND